MKHVNRIVFLTLAVLLLGGLLFAAGSKETQAADSGKPTSIVFYLWDDPAYKPIIEAYNNSQKKIFVDAKWIPTNDYEAKIATLLAGGAEMDGYMQKRSTDIFAHNANGYIAPLGELCKKYGYDLNAIAGYKQAITIGNDVLAIPFRGASYFTYYNKKIFKDAGIPTPDTYVKAGTWTWKKFIEAAKQISQKNPEIYGGFLYTWGSNNVIPALQNGMQFIDASGKIDINKSLINSFVYRKELEQAKAIMPLTETKITKTHYSKPFYDGKAAMLIIGEWFPGFMTKAKQDNLLVGYTWDDWSLTRIPCDEATYRTFGNPTFSHVHADSKNKDATFQFIAWMGGPAGAKLVASLGLLPAYLTNEVKNEFTKSLPDATALQYFTEPVEVKTQFYNKYGSKVESELAAIMEEYLASPLSDDKLEALIRDRLSKVAEQIR